MPKDPVILNLFTQKDLIEAIEKAKEELKEKKKQRRKKNCSTKLKLNNKMNT